MLGADFEKESLDEYFLQKNQKLHYVDIVKRAKVIEIEKDLYLVLHLQMLDIQKCRSAFAIAFCEQIIPWVKY